METTGTNRNDLSVKTKRLLIIDDEQNMRHMLTAMFSKSAYQVDAAADGREGLERIGQHNYDFILCDIKMPKMDGIAFLQEAGSRLGSATVIMMSAYGTVDVAVEAMKLGAYDFISKPFKADEVRLIFKKAEEREKLKTENRQLRERIQRIQENFSFYTMVGRSRTMQAVYELAQKAGSYDTTVLITGESGTGKELIARGIHFTGKRSVKSFVPLNCGGIPENLLESELFGHVKGAFTGADRYKTGLFEEADGGTIFLDEIGELPIALQVKLLRVLQENEIRPVGGSKTRSINVRVIAATARKLEDEIKENRFREDLFYRLNVLRIHAPSLKDWAEDIPLLCHHFINLFNEKFNKCIRGISPAGMALLMKYEWPGNVRELENMIERAMVLTDGNVLTPENFPVELDKKTAASARAGDILDGYSLKKAQKVLEKELITKALKQTGGNRTQAARLLEISHPSLLSKMKTYNIE